MSLLRSHFYQITIRYVYITMFIRIGSLAYEKLKNALTKKRLLKGIKQVFCKFYSIGNVR